MTSDDDLTQAKTAEGAIHLVRIQADALRKDAQTKRIEADTLDVLATGLETAIEHLLKSTAAP